MNYFNYCFNRSYKLNNVDTLVFNFFEANFRKTNRELKVLKNTSAENELEKNFDFLIEFKKTNFNLYYYF